MARPLAVIIGSLLLLGVGFFLGSRPAARLSGQLEEASTEFQVKVAEFERRALEAEDAAALQAVRAGLYAAAHAAVSREMTEATLRGQAALDLLVRTEGNPTMTVDLDPVHALLERALVASRAGDPDAGPRFLAAAEELGLLLDRKQA
jgi:hypothetical protein